MSVTGLLTAREGEAKFVHYNQAITQPTTYCPFLGGGAGDEQATTTSEWVTSVVIIKEKRRLYGGG